MIPDANSVSADAEVDDEALVQQYDLGNGVGQEIFGALDSGGLEEIGDDEDECVDQEDLDQDGMSGSSPALLL